MFLLPITTLEKADLRFGFHKSRAALIKKVKIIKKSIVSHGYASFVIFLRFDVSHYMPHSQICQGGFQNFW